MTILYYLVLNISPGDRIIVVVQKQRSFGETGPGSNNLSIANRVRRGDMRHAVVVRARKEIQRPDGSVIKFDDNACVLINKSGDPIGTRLTSKRNLQFLLNSLLIQLSKVSWARNCGIDNGPRFCHLHRCTYRYNGSRIVMKNLFGRGDAMYSILS